MKRFLAVLLVLLVLYLCTLVRLRREQTRETYLAPLGNRVLYNPYLYNRLTGVLGKLYLARALPYPVVKTSLAPLTAELMLHSSGTPPPRDWMHTNLVPYGEQGDCGACWAFSVCSMLMDRILTTRGVVLGSQPSIQQILSCYNRQGCEGGSPEELLQWMEQHPEFHILSSTRIPYRQMNSSIVQTECTQSKVGLQIVPNSIRRLTEFVPENEYDVDVLAANIQRIKKDIALHGPCYGVITVYEDLLHFAGDGVYQHDPQSRPLGGHALEVIGYKGNEYWWCRNSWGGSWPLGTRNGVFRIRMGYNECGIESRCGSALPLLKERM